MLRGRARGGASAAATTRMRLGGGGSGAVPWPAALEGFPGGAGGGEVLRAVRALLPPLESGLHKGQAGKVGVLGGCAEYSGAPYYAAMSALRVGCDLSHVFCAETAAPVIKGYSPELIVHPYLHESSPTGGGEEGGQVEAGAQRVQEWFSRLTCLVIGPGLGRDPSILAAARDVLQRARAADLPLVLDADGLHLVQQEPELVRGYAKAVLTPNANEFRRLCSSLAPQLPAESRPPPEVLADGRTGSEDEDWKAKAAELERHLEASPDDVRKAQVAEVASALGGVTVLLKGEVDIVSDGRTTLEVGFRGCPRRCGGQGDVLAGATATFVSWALNPKVLPVSAKGGGETYPPAVLAAYGGAFTARFAAHFAFQQHGRAMVGGDLLEHVGPCVGRYFDGPTDAPKGFGFTK